MPPVRQREILGDNGRRKKQQVNSDTNFEERPHSSGGVT